MGSIILIAFRVFLPYIYDVPYLTNSLGDNDDRGSDESFVSIYTSIQETLKDRKYYPDVLFEQK